jgi:uncharacterized membrane protein YcaP (DUF421 family)
MFFNGWSGLIRLIAVGIPAYVALILLLRISGKRTLSKFNAFDLIVTVAFGSMLASALLNSDRALADVIGAFALLVLLQFVITWSSVRWSAVHALVKAKPQLLYHRGEFLHDALRRERITETEVLAAIRSQGNGSTSGVDSVVLETDGTFSVVTNVEQGTSALRSVRGHPAGSEEQGTRQDNGGAGDA